jgi:Asp-tRNA(Asn)/Glu-tRNA(Gln) amidotransferase A subunit family amidase
VELVDAHLAEIEQRDPELHAFVMKFPSEARAAAIHADNSSIERPLHGIPVTIKDSFDMRDLPTLCGSRLRLEHRAQSDSAAVRRLREAGAIILGKTNCPEFLANYETDNAITGWTANPNDLSRSAGGSSGGEAAAIGAFCSAGGVGSDGGGSIRIPAHFCGIAGLKPTPGRVSAAGHCPEIAHPGGLLGVAGPMARNAADLRILFDVLKGYDPADPFSAPVAVQNRAVTRVGVMEQFAAQDSVHAAVKKAARLLEEIRIPVEPFRCPEIDAAPAVWWFFFTELTSSITREMVEHWTGTELLAMIEQDRTISGREVVERLSQRDSMRAALLRAMQDVPVLLLPVCAVTAFRARERSWPTTQGVIGLREAMAPSTMFNLLGCPALTIPIERDSDGLPVGIQLVGRPWEEETLLDLAVELETRVGFSLHGA